MRISVVIPTYNRREEVKKALQSVLDQTLKPSEVIVVDDGSTDSTAEYLKENSDSEVRIITRPHRGVAAARNRGIQESTGEWLTFLDSDDTWLPQKLERQAAFHYKNPELLISQTDDVWIRNGKPFNRRKYHVPQAGWIFNLSLERCMISPSAVMVNRKILDNVGSFDEGLPACEDYDLWLRVTAKYPVGLIEEKLVIKLGGHPDQLSQKYWAMDRFRIQALEKILEFSLSCEQRQQTVKMLVTKLTILKNGSLKRNKNQEAEDYQQKLEEYQAKLEKKSGICLQNSSP